MTCRPTTQQNSRVRRRSHPWAAVQIGTDRPCHRNRVLVCQAERRRDGFNAFAVTIDAFPTSAGTRDRRSIASQIALA